MREWKGMRKMKMLYLGMGDAGGGMSKTTLSILEKS